MFTCRPSIKTTEKYYFFLASHIFHVIQDGFGPAKSFGSRENHWGQVFSNEFLNACSFV
jgi:hypothetical protein